MIKPLLKPSKPHFSSGPCSKRPGWSLAALQDVLTGRSHRSKSAMNKLCQVIEETKALLNIPEDYHIAIVPGSDTGAIEMALWNFLGHNPVTVLAWDVFGREWVKDIKNQLKIAQLDVREAKGGDLPDLSDIPSCHDIVFTWTGTTSGASLENGQFISSDRTGLTICDAVSAIFAVDLPWSLLDVVSFSWQKALGGESGHGMIVLSPAAYKCLATKRPPWPVPRLFRLAEDGLVREGVFAGKTINTPSLLCVEDCLDALQWARQIGGLSAMIARTQENFDCIDQWVLSNKDWIDFRARNPQHRSKTSVCLKLVSPSVLSLSKEEEWSLIAKITQLLAEEAAGFDLKGHYLDEPNIRIWAGPTVETQDIERLLPWIKWAYFSVIGTKK